MIVYHLDLGETVSLCCLLRAESGSVTAGSIKKVNGLTNGEMCKWVSSNITVLHFLPSPLPVFHSNKGLLSGIICLPVHYFTRSLLKCYGTNHLALNKKIHNTKNEKLRKFNELYNCLTFGLISVSSLKQIVLMLSSSSPKNSFPDH